MTDFCYEWQPIETAPKDWTWVIVKCDGYNPSTARWNVDTGRWENASNMLGYDVCTEWPLTHWMPQPLFRPQPPREL